jgi:hypothetical protein
MPYFVLQTAQENQWRCACGFETRVFWTFGEAGDPPGRMVVPEDIREAKRRHINAGECRQ